MLTTSGSRVNGIHFSGFSTLSIFRAVRAERARNRESTDLDSSSVAFLLSGLRQILSPSGLSVLMEMVNFFTTVFKFNTNLVGSDVF